MNTGIIKLIMKLLKVDYYLPKKNKKMIGFIYDTPLIPLSRVDNWKSFFMFLKFVTSLTTLITIFTTDNKGNKVCKSLLTSQQR